MFNPLQRFFAANIDRHKKPSDYCRQGGVDARFKHTHPQYQSKHDIRR